MGFPFIHCLKVELCIFRAAPNFQSSKGLGGCSCQIITTLYWKCEQDANFPK